MARTLRQELVSVNNKRVDERCKFQVAYMLQRTKYGIKRDVTSSAVGPGQVRMTNRESFSVGGNCVGDSQADRIDKNIEK